MKDKRVLWVIEELVDGAWEVVDSTSFTRSEARWLKKTMRYGKHRVVKYVPASEK